MALLKANLKCDELKEAEKLRIAAKVRCKKKLLMFSGPSYGHHQCVVRDLALVNGGLINVVGCLSE